MKNIILIGFMGTGKSSVARVLNKEFGLQLIDTDARIEELQGTSISEIFRTKGEDSFRVMETELIKNELMCRNNTVISCGGGMPLYEINRELLKKSGVVFWLKASVDELMSRLGGDTTRPLLQCDDPKSRIKELLCTREPLYSDASCHSIATDGKTPAKIASEIIEIMRKEV